MGGSGQINLSNDQLAFELGGDKGLYVRRLALPGGTSWLNENVHNPGFSLHVDGKKIDGQTENVTVIKEKRPNCMTDPHIMPFSWNMNSTSCTSIITPSFIRAPR